MGQRLCCSKRWSLCSHHTGQILLLYQLKLWTLFWNLNFGTVRVVPCEQNIWSHEYSTGQEFVQWFMNACSLTINFSCLFQILRHPTKPNVTPVEVLPVFPDFQVVFIHLHEVIYQTQDTLFHHIFKKNLVENVMGRVVLVVGCVCFVWYCQDEHFVECLKKSNPLCYTSVSNKSEVQVSELSINKTHTITTVHKLLSKLAHTQLHLVERKQSIHNVQYHPSHLRHDPWGFRLDSFEFWEQSSESINTI